MGSRDQEFRPDLYIVARIIKNLIENGPINKTKLSTYSELSYDKFISYLNWMASRELVNENDGSVHITEKGIETYNELVEWILKYVGKFKFSRRKF